MTRNNLHLACALVLGAATGVHSARAAETAAVVPPAVAASFDEDSVAEPFSPELAQLAIPKPPAASGCGGLTQTSKNAWQMGYAQGLSGNRFERPIKIGNTTSEETPDHPKYRACAELRSYRGRTAQKDLQCCISGFQNGIALAKDRILQLKATQKKELSDREAGCLNSFAAGETTGDFLCRKEPACPTLQPGSVRFRGCFEQGFKSNYKNCDTKVQPGPADLALKTSSEKTEKLVSEPDMESKSSTSEPSAGSASEASP